MSDCMIIRRGGGGKGFDPNGAVLKIITSTGCTVIVTGTGYSKTHQQADGFPRSDDANVTEHFFSIPASAFGTITVKATNTYGDNTKTLTVDTAGKVYELLCGGTNIILDGTFGLQSGYSLRDDNWEYIERYKYLRSKNSYTLENIFFGTDVPVAPYEQIKVTGRARNSDRNSFEVSDEDGIELCVLSGFTTSQSSYTTKTGSLTNKYYPTAGFSAALDTITEIVLL